MFIDSNCYSHTVTATKSETISQYHIRRTALGTHWRSYIIFMECALQYRNRKVNIVFALRLTHTTKRNQNFIKLEFYQQQSDINSIDDSIFASWKCRNNKTKSTICCALITWCLRCFYERIWYTRACILAVYKQISRKLIALFLEKHTNSNGSFAFGLTWLGVGILSSLWPK